MANSLGDERLQGRVSRWFAEVNGCYDITSAISRSIEQLLSASGQTAPPVSLGIIAGERGVVRTVYASGIRSGGRLVPGAEGFVISLQKGAHWYTQKEWWAHEIAHTFFFDIHARPPKRLLADSGAEEEAICDLLAQELVAPTRFLKETSCSRHPSLLELEKLCRLFETTYSTMSKRILRDLELWPPAVVVLCEQCEHLFPRSKVVNHPEVLLRVTRSFGPGRPGFFVPRNKIVEKMPVFSEAFNKGRFAEGLVTFKRFGDIRGTRRVEAMPFCKGERGSNILALIDLENVYD